MSSLLNSLDPLTDKELGQLKSLLVAQRVEEVYSSNAIEGSSLTLRETEIVLSQGITIGGKPLRDHLDAVNLNHALTKVDELVLNRQPISLSTLLDLHKIVLAASEEAGRLRNTSVFIKGAKHVPPSSHEVFPQMEKLMDFYHQHFHKAHPVLLAADLHHGLAYIHPFTDGNGRMARLVASLHLAQRNYPPLIIQPADRQKYYEALEAVDLHYPIGFKTKQEIFDAKTNPFRDFTVETIATRLKHYRGVLLREEAKDLVERAREQTALKIQSRSISTGGGLSL